MSKPILLDLYCGGGGAARGYQEAGFYVVGVDIKPQPNYVGDYFLQEDVMQFLGGPEARSFDVIHASPPCQAYIQRNKNLVTKWPKLIEPTRAHLKRIGVPYVIENVLPEVLESPWMLCGTMFGLPLIRHRYFEVSPSPLMLLPDCNHWGSVASGDFAAVYARGGKGHRRGAGVRDAAPAPAKVTWEEAMGIDWMTRDELREAIPPAYAKFIGEHLIKTLATGRQETGRTLP